MKLHVRPKVPMIRNFLDFILMMMYSWFEERTHLHHMGNVEKERGRKGFSRP